MKQRFNITGMTCASCQGHVEKAVRKLPGVKNVNVNLLSANMDVEYDESRLTPDAIIQAVAEAGYGANLPEMHSQNAVEPTNPLGDEIRIVRKRLILSVIFLTPLMYVSMGHMMHLPMPSLLNGRENAVVFAFTLFLLTLPLLYVNRNFFETGLKLLFKREPNMDSLIAIGAGAAVIYGTVTIFRLAYAAGHLDFAMVDRYAMDVYFESAGMILTLITLGKYLEARSKGKTGDALSKLIRLAPKTALVERGNSETEIEVSEIRLGDIIVIKPGFSIPVDGTVTEGNSSVDESALTGESLPVEKAPGDKVISASINKSGFFKFKAEKVGNDTTLAQIIRLVEDAGNSKAPIAKLADRISGVFVPVVIGIAILTFLVWIIAGHTFGFALSNAIAVLVISCPCALGLATPVAIMVGTGKGAENGILFKSAEALETASKINCVVLDKTGTLTEGKPRVTDIIPAEDISETELLSVAYSLEKASEHPLAEAIIEKAKDMGVLEKDIRDFKAVPGEGISAIIGDENCFAGNLAMMKKNSLDISPLQKQSDVFAENGKTPLYFSTSKKLLGVIAVADILKATSHDAVKAFKSMKMDVVMLTGDNRKTAEAIRRQLDIDRAIAEVLPQDKEKTIRELQMEGKTVAMIGDGINDAPALVRADLGIAIGAGTDVAVESADLVLVKSDLLDAVTGLRLGKATMLNIKENLFWAFFYNVVGIPLAAGVFYPFFGWTLNPIFGAAAMSMSSVSVVANALRLRWFKPSFERIPQFAEPKQEMIRKKGGTKVKKLISVEGMTCNHCKATVEKALKELDPVDDAVVDLAAKTVFVTLANNGYDDLLVNTINDLGYKATGIKNA